MKKAVLISEPS